MYDPTIRTETLARQLQAADFAADKQLLDPRYRQLVLDRAVGLGCQGFDPASLTRSLVRGKHVFRTTDIAEALVLRHITSNIRRITGVKQDDRSFIVHCIKSLVAEGLPFRAYKFDVSKFYESVQVASILARLREDVAFSGQSVRSLTSFFNQLSMAGIHGLPRGLSLSATLAEYLMRGFDRQMSGTDGVWYYARFVDDIIIITDGREDNQAFRKMTQNFLPAGLAFNRKSKSVTFLPFAKGHKDEEENAFDFLGYRFGVSKAWRNATNRIVRTVKVDLAASKLRKFKTRVARSFVLYQSDHSFLDLRDRIRLLSSNVVYVDANTGVRRASGIRFNYPLIDHASSIAIPALDRFLSSAVMSPHPRNVLRPANLTDKERKELVGLSFASGFASQRFFHFSNPRLARLTVGWAHV